MGTGIERIRRALKEAKVPQIQYEFMPFFVKAVFPRPEEVTEIASHVTPEDGANLALSRAQVEAQEAQVEAYVHLSVLDKSILAACKDLPKTGRDLVDISGYATRTGNLKRSIAKLIGTGLIEMTIPSKPRSANQKYRLTENGKKLLAGLIK